MNIPDLVELAWVAPPDELLAKKLIRKNAIDLMTAPVQAAIRAAWRAELPENKWAEADRMARKGLRYAVETLTISTKHRRFDLVWSPLGIRRVPPYWEPPVAVESDLPRFQLQAYRWVAAIIGLRVRNNLENLHSAYTSDDCMPALNQGIRNAVYAVLLEQPYIAWELSPGLRVVIMLHHNHIPGADIPAVAGG